MHGAALSEDANGLPARNASDVPVKRDRAAKMRLLTLDDLDRRTRAAQHARHIKERVLADLGGADRLSTLQVIMADNAAVLACQLADLKVRWLKGEDVDPATVATITNVFNRSAAMLGLARQPRDIAPDLKSYLADSAARNDAEPMSEPEPQEQEPGAPQLDPGAGPAASAEPAALGEPAQVGDVVSIEGRANLRFTERLGDGRERWWIERLDGFLMEPHFSREAAEQRAKQLIEQGRLR